MSALSEWRDAYCESSEQAIIEFAKFIYYRRVPCQL